MSKPIQKGYFGGMFFEFILQNRKADAMIILPDFPSKNSYNRMIDLFYDRGYHVFVPRFKGSYQSNGKFLAKNPVDDIVSFVEDLDKGEIKSLLDMKKQVFKINKKMLLAGGLSGTIALGAAAKSNLFSHIILVSPIWDAAKHNADGNESDLKNLGEYVRRAYKNCYRYIFKDLVKKLGKFEELKPEFYIKKLNAPVLVMHDPNDKAVSLRHTQETLPLLKKGNYLEHHLGHEMTDSMLHAFWKEIDKFIKINYLYDKEKEKEEQKEEQKEEIKEEVKGEKIVDNNIIKETTEK